ncbi:MAG: hypothetical protein EOP20_03380 [Hyphomicrobiales bacterium]|nr:MAG: hypothetical protein EOP20_03380 [Hyphomicrobiales bacterium]
MSPQRKKVPVPPVLVREWTLPTSATLGSSVRAKGILLEIRAQLPSASRKMLDIKAGVLTLGMPEGADAAFAAVSATVEKVLGTVEDLPVIPREIEDILTISTTERHRWLKDGRLQSAGTRTVKLRGRARKITFHVFDPRRVEDMLDGELVDAWREQDAETAAENRRRAAWKLKLARSQKAAAKQEGAPKTPEDAQAQKLAGWEEFEREGLLR